MNSNSQYTPESAALDLPLAPKKSRLQEFWMLFKQNRLAIIDAVRVQYDRGPGFVPQFTAWYGGVIISDDPVAADRIGLEIVGRLRADHGRPPLSAEKRDVRYLKTAGEIGLGTADLDRIDLVVLQDGAPVGKELFQ